MPRISKKDRVREYAAARGWARIGEAEWRELRAVLPDISAATLRTAGIEIDQPWRGIAQHTLAELEECLCEFSEIYAARPDLRKYCREEAIAAKDHARAIAKSARVEEAKRAAKAEMVEWMLVWLGDPAVFPVWLRARRRGLERTAREPSL